MGSPSSGHEARVAELEDLAALAGFTGDVRLPWRLRPDVARICPINGAVFIGDAKQTEDPDCVATRRRLRWYATALCALPGDDQVTVALAVPSGSAVPAWQRTLVLAVRGRMVCEPPSLLVIGGTTVVATRAGHVRSGREHTYRDRPWPAGTDNAPSAPSTSSVAGAA